MVMMRSLSCHDDLRVTVRSLSYDQREARPMRTSTSFLLPSSLSPCEFSFSKLVSTYRVLASTTTIPVTLPLVAYRQDEMWNTASALANSNGENPNPDRNRDISVRKPERNMLSFNVASISISLMIHIYLNGPEP